MNDIPHKLNLDWSALIKRISLDLAVFPAGEKAWLRERLSVIAAIQVELDDFFHKADGCDACAGCEGACCACGRHHVTLTNLLAYLLAGETPPEPDFRLTCPFLGEGGCLLTVDRRPYNCITFFCDTLEEQLSDDDCQALRTLDRRLRDEYLQIAARYPAASLRGIWIALQRAGDESLLQSIAKDVIE